MLIAHDFRLIHPEKISRFEFQLRTEMSEEYSFLSYLLPSKNPCDILDAALTFRLMRQPEKAQILYRAASRHPLETPFDIYYVANGVALTGALSIARELFIKAATHIDVVPEWQRVIGDELVKLDDVDLAKKVYLESALSSLADVSDIIAAACKFYHLDDYENAVNLFVMASQDASIKPDMLTTAAKAFNNLGYKEDSKELYLRATECEDTSPYDHATLRLV